MLVRPLFALLLALALVVPTEARAQLQVDADAVVVGQPVTVQMPDTADTLRVTYRPSSSIAQTRVFATTGSSFTWTPEQAGVVRLAADTGESINVSVRFQQLPISGLAVLIVAGLLLFGGAILAAMKLFQRDDADRIAPF